MKLFNPKTLFIALCAVATLSACKDDSVGDKVDEAGKDAGRAVKDATD